MKPGKMMYEGKAKRVFETDDPDLVIQYFKDDATAFNAEKKGSISEKGIINNRMSAFIFANLEKNGIPTHLVESLSDREMLCKKLEIVPVEVIMRNVAAGSLAKRLGWKEGKVLPQSILEFYYKDDALGDPMINRDHIRILDAATDEEMEKISAMARKINEILVPFFKEALGLTLVDFKLEFGRHKGEIILGDEISPDTCRLWDVESGEKMDKDRFRFDLGNVEGAYQEVFKRLSGAGMGA